MYTAYSVKEQHKITHSLPWTAWISPGTSTGLDWSSVSPMPNWPLKLLPQHLTPPPLAIMQVWRYPKAIAMAETSAWINNEWSNFFCYSHFQTLYYRVILSLPFTNTRLRSYHFPYCRKVNRKCIWSQCVCAIVLESQKALVNSSFWNFLILKNYVFGCVCRYTV